MIPLVIDAVNVILRQLGELPEGPETRELRDAALGCIEEVVMWNVRRPSVEVRDALMKKVLALHVMVRKASGAAPPPERPIAVVRSPLVARLVLGVGPGLRLPSASHATRDPALEPPPITPVAEEEDGRATSARA